MGKESSCCESFSTSLVLTICRQVTSQNINEAVNIQVTIWEDTKKYFSYHQYTMRALVLLEEIPQDITVEKWVPLSESQLDFDDEVKIKRTMLRQLQKKEERALISPSERFGPKIKTMHASKEREKQNMLKLGYDEGYWNALKSKDTKKKKKTFNLVMESVTVIVVLVAMLILITVEILRQGY